MNKLGTLVALFVALLVSAFTLVSPSPASAESETVHDASGEVPEWMDVVALRATNNQHRMRVVLHVRDLQDRGKFELGFRWNGGDDVGYYFFVRVRQTDDGIKTDFRHEKQSGDSSPKWTCAENHGTFSYDPEDDRILLAVPHACLRAYDGIRVINNWGGYGVSYGGYVDGELRFDSQRTKRLQRG